MDLERPVEVRQAHRRSIELIDEYFRSNMDALGWAFKARIDGLDAQTNRDELIFITCDELRLGRLERALYSSSRLGIDDDAVSAAVAITAAYSGNRAIEDLAVRGLSPRRGLRRQTKAIIDAVRQPGEPI